MEITCPSGLSGEVRKLKGAEANVLADRKAARSGEVYEKILKSCWVRTTDSAIYQVEEGASLPWDKVLTCDRFYTLVAIRIATYGPEYVFRVQCGGAEGAGCSDPIDWEINIERELPLYDLPEESRTKIANGDNRFETEVDGKTVVFKLQTGADQQKARKRIRQKREEMVTASLATRIVEVEDLKRHEVEKWLEGLDMDLQLDLLAQMEEVDGGFETSFEVECSSCNMVQEAEVPFQGKSFWLPQRKKKDRKKGRQARTMAGTDPDR